MASKNKTIETKKFRIKPDAKINLDKISTKPSGSELSKEDAKSMLDASRTRLAEIQDMFYAHNQYAVLIIFQAMDAAGKDGAVKHIMSGFNPLGVKVYSFKAPNSTELDHIYFWRHQLALPARGEIAIHNRSHYENVLVTRVHPEYVLNENIPGIDDIKKVNKDFWNDRFKQIRRFEKNLNKNGTIVLKFFLHLSKKEQKKRFLERIDNPGKNWKFSLSDMKERGFWDAYQKAYSEAISETSTKNSPWFVVPADDKRFARLAIASIITEEFEKLKIHYPKVSEKQKAELQKAKAQLLAEDGKKPNEKAAETTSKDTKK
ncbi:MAG TPA: polyphosphate kinase 2 family protein [Cyclobacteriaceae bacterium]|nr:polyphosphate kinase 2 family protein [Cyclobacteriaceae bacterium]HMV08934.1 polyphosphate kinase 2 family protein [Cyclobacteriaceae bacterium]HMV90436.1 polyphosphate kinase 2 family protein [Cyclobacteriaceae bacterium]HMX00311.1 polyphosphate kinase 2 family protein [Cyclobacteriaceae bacterium]HMX49690.1 polyphosphate kinase 2 family protein [Cyclobacteriaceae bacterium]